MTLVLLGVPDQQEPLRSGARLKLLAWDLINFQLLCLDDALNELLCDQVVQLVEVFSRLIETHFFDFLRVIFSYSSWVDG